MTESSRPEHPVAIVTGAARGIGAAIALRLAQDGHDIAVIDLDESDCEKTVQSIRTFGRRAYAVACDVSDEQSAIAAVERIASNLGPPLVLVNNAGVIRDRVMQKTTIADWELVLNVNLRGTFLMSREVCKHMRTAHWGRIVNLSSTGALGHLGQANYSAAKAGIQGFTKTTAIELGRYNITVNAVAPGFTVTDMTESLAKRLSIAFEDMVTDAVREIPVGRAGHPEDVANAVAFFVDVRSGFVNGQILYVAGGPHG